MIRVACIQPKILETNQQCYEEIEELLNSLLFANPEIDIICLPEKWLPLKKKESENIQDERGEAYKFIKLLAKKHKVAIISGAIWEKRSNIGKPKITSYFFDQKGIEIGRQDKLHLYSYEREVFEPGDKLNIFSFNKFQFAILICFDMAFFETPRLAVENGAEILFSPTQIREEGMKNWEIYLKARALENRIPVVACNTFGSFRRSIFPGHSKIISFINGYVSPSKLSVVEAPFNNSGYIYDEIDIEFPKKLREVRLKEKLEKSSIEVVFLKK